MQSASIAADIPVLLRLVRSEQADTNGCNFVAEITAIVYKEIVDGKIKLWDSPAKEIQITGITLQELEKNTNTKFVNQDVIFIYELWQNNRKMLTSETLGFNFSNKSSNGEDVAYGFVEYAAVKDLFLRTKIHTNANGDYSATYASYVNNKTYNYNIIQFNGKVIREASESNKIKKEFIGDAAFNLMTFVSGDPDRYIQYIVEPNSELKDPRGLNSNRLVKEIENYLTTNQEVFYNFGGDRILSYFQKNQLKVTRLEFTEIWKKINDTLVTEPKTMTIFVNDSALMPMNSYEINKLDLKIDEMNFGVFIRQKKFNLIISQINSQKIPRKDAFLYYKGLMNSEWKRLTAYVSNF